MIKQGLFVRCLKFLKKIIWFYQNYYGICPKLAKSIDALHLAKTRLLPQTERGRGSKYVKILVISTVYEKQNWWANFDIVEKVRDISICKLFSCDMTLVELVINLINVYTINRKLVFFSFPKFDIHLDLSLLEKQWLL